MTSRVWAVLPLGLVVAGVVSVAAAVVADLGLVPYVLGVATGLVGVVLLVAWRTRRSVVPRVVAVSVVVAGVVAAATLAVTGWSSRPDSWDIAPETAPDLSGVSARLGNALYVGGTAYDAATGGVRWKASGGDDEARLIAVTAHIVVVLQDAAGDAAQLAGRDPATGRVLWSVETSKYVRGIAHDGDTLVTSQWRRSKHRADGSTVTVAYDLRTGEPVWRDSRRAAVVECELGDAVARFAPALRQQAVLLSDAPERSPSEVQVARISDGRIVGTSLSCQLAVRVVGDVVLYADHRQLVAGLSATTGKRLWRTTAIPDPWNLSGRGAAVFSGEDYDGPVGEPRTRYRSIDLHAGRTRTVAPPNGWVVGLDDTRHQRGASVWMPVFRGESGGMWRLGSAQVVRVPDAVGGLAIAESDVSSGWLALEGHTEDIVGDRHARAWALSPDGRLYGPFPGHRAWVASGVITVDDTMYPLR